MIQLILLLSLLVVARIVVNGIFRRVLTTPPDLTERCVCGYNLENLSVPRCPECGRVVGFRATAQELGLSEEELQRAQLAKEKRKDAGSNKPAS